MKRNSMNTMPGLYRDHILAHASTKPATIALSILLSCFYFLSEKSAEALNGYTRVAICSCTTTADFVTAAKTFATANGLNHPLGYTGQTLVGTYTMVSTTSARTAYIQLTGTLIGVGKGPPYYNVTAAVPIDSTGASIASKAESVQVAFYTSLDQVIFGMNRASPLFATDSNFFPPSFINTTDAQMSAAIDAWLQSYGISVGLPATVTISFPDGTTAEFEANLTGLPWTWNGVAHNKNGQLINRNGTVRQNPNTSGSGGGNGTGAGGGNTIWNITGGGACGVGASVTLPDGTVYTNSGWEPC